MPHLNSDLKPVFGRLHAYLLVALCAVSSLGSVGCAERAWQRSTEVTLNVMRMGVDSSWALAIEHQREAENAIIHDGAARAAGLDAAGRQAILEEAQSALELVRQRHHAWYGKFRFIRQLHAEAVGAYEAYRSGRGTRATFFAAMEPLLGAWRELQEILPNSGLPQAHTED